MITLERGKEPPRRTVVFDVDEQVLDNALGQAVDIDQGSANFGQHGVRQGQQTCARRSEPNRVGLSNEQTPADEDFEIL
ncbi:MAG: hypothetical protein OXL38_14230 [Gammaproteobacteria bacterium]|nr:hypothetical protein [Gammaproteobacteria bacterium]